MNIEYFLKNMNNLVLENEYWKNISPFGEEYQASNLGRIRRFNSKTNNFEILKVSLERNGYWRVSFLSKSFFVHRLVALAFIPNPNNYNEINHKDGDKSNNCVENLEWCTRSQNMKHAFDMGLKINKKGAESLKAKEVYQYDLNGNFIKKYNCISEASPSDDCLKSSISACCKGKIKTAGGYIWSYNFEEIDPKNHEADLGFPVYQYTIEGKFVKKWKNSKIAAEQLGFNHSNICKVCRKERESADGFIWSYKYELLEANERLIKKESKIYQFDKKGNLIKEWDNVKTASKTLNINYDDIRACCNKNKKMTGGYIWSYEKEINYLEYRPIQEKPVYQYDLEYNFIKKWDSATEAAETLNMNRKNISAVCNKTRKKTGGYIWSFTPLD